MTTATKSPLPLFKDVPVGDEVIHVTRIKFGNHHKFFALIGSVLQNVAPAFQGKPEFDISQLMLHGGEEIMQALALAINKDRDYLDTIAIEDGYKLLEAVIEINKEYLIKEVMPLVTSILGQMKAVPKA